MNEMPGSQNAEVQQGVERLSVLMAAGVESGSKVPNPELSALVNNAESEFHRKDTSQLQQDGVCFIFTF